MDDTSKRTGKIFSLSRALAQSTGNPGSTTDDPASTAGGLCSNRGCQYMALLVHPTWVHWPVGAWVSGACWKCTLPSGPASFRRLSHIYRPWHADSCGHPITHQIPFVWMSKPRRMREPYGCDSPEATMEM